MVFVVVVFRNRSFVRSFNSFFRALSSFDLISSLFGTMVPGHAHSTKKTNAHVSVNA